jgi:hypothetical protein
MWQWNSHRPARVGTQAMANDVPGAMNSVTAVRARPDA